MFREAACHLRKPLLLVHLFLNISLALAPVLLPRIKDDISITIPMNFRNL